MFGIDLFDATLLPSLFVALLAGLISFVSPCVLPIVPPYLAYMSGVSMAELEANKRARRRAIFISVSFVLGLSTVFLLLGFAASSLGTVVLSNKLLFTQISGVVITLFGLHFLGVFRIPFLDREARFDAEGAAGTAFGAYILGLAFAFGWTPCIGPQLGTILSLAAIESSVGRGTALLGVYAIGLGLPFILSAVFLAQAVQLMKRIKPHMAIIEKAMGALLVVVGLAMVLGLFTRFSFWLIERFPALATIG